MPRFIPIAIALAFLACSTELAEVGRAAPPLRLADAAGTSVSLQSFKGKVVLVSFWATWCDSCREEMRLLEGLYRKHKKDGFVILAPSVDEGGRAAILPFIAQVNPSFPILLADLKTARAYRVKGLPTGWLVDARGILTRRYPGPVDAKTLENDILQELKRSRS